MGRDRQRSEGHTPGLEKASFPAVSSDRDPLSSVVHSWRALHILSTSREGQAKVAPWENDGAPPHCLAIPKA